MAIGIRNSLPKYIPLIIRNAKKSMDMLFEREGVDVNIV
jgi:hypothetical protein